MSDDVPERELPSVTDLREAPSTIGTEADQYGTATEMDTEGMGPAPLTESPQENHE